MKTTLLSLIAVVGVFGTLSSASAQVPPALPMGVQPYPGERRIVSYLTNGTPVYAVYQAMGYDAMGYPIYQWVTLPTSTYVRPYSSGYGYGYRNHYYRAPVYVRPNYVRPRYVVPPVHHSGPTHFGGPVPHGSFHGGPSGGGHVSHGGGGGGHVSHGGGHGGGHHR